MLAPQKESIFGCSCRLWLLSWRRARVFARSCSLLSKYLPISWKQRKEQSHAQCHVTHRIRIFDKISEHVKIAKSVDIAIPELAVTNDPHFPLGYMIFHSVSGFLFSGSDEGFFMKVGKSITLLASGFFGTVRLFCFQLTKKTLFSTLNGTPPGIFQRSMILKMFDNIGDLRSSSGVLFPGF